MDKARDVVDGSVVVVAAVYGDAVEMVCDLANLETVVNPVGAKAWTEPCGVDTMRTATSSRTGGTVKTERLCRCHRVPNPSF